MSIGLDWGGGGGGGGAVWDVVEKLGGVVSDLFNEFMTGVRAPAETTPWLALA